MPNIDLDWQETVDDDEDKGRHLLGLGGSKRRVNSLGKDINTGGRKVLLPPSPADYSYMCVAGAFGVA